MENSTSLSTNQFSLSADGKKLCLTLNSSQKNTTVEDLVKALKSSTYKDLKISKAGLDEVIDKVNKITKGVTEPIVIAERHDAKLLITLDPLKVTAKAQVTTAYGGEHITPDQVIAEVKALGITVGINNAAIMVLITKSRKAVPGTPYQITIATGTEPINGHDAYFTSLLKPQKEQLITSMKEQYGSVDMEKIESVVTIEKGTKLIRKHPHVAGRGGLTVTNHVLTHTTGQDIPFHIGENTKISETDPNVLISTVQGTAIQLETGMKIEPSMILDSIENNADPIFFEGTLVIKGDVLPGANIITTGDLTVIGFIESSAVKCGGDLFVSKGIIGDRGDGSCNKSSTKVECAGSLYASFIQYSTVTVKHNVNVQFQIVHSNIFCDEYIRVGNKEHLKGAIFGGYLSAKKGIQAINLGATSGVKTTLDLNSVYIELVSQEKKLSATLDDTSNKIQDTLKAQLKLNDLASTDKTKQLKKRLVLTINDLKSHFSSLKNKIQDNKNKQEEYLKNTKLNALQTIYSNVSIGIGKQVFTSVKQYGPTTLLMKNRKLVAEVYKK